MNEDLDITYETEYGTLESMQAALDAGADPNRKVWDCGEWDSAVSLCFYAAIGDIPAKLKLLLACPTLDAGMVVESMARRRDSVLPFDEGMLASVKDWASGRGVDVEEVFRTTPAYPSTTLFEIPAGSFAWPEGASKGEE